MNPAPVAALDLLLMRVLDGEADEAERAELLALADAEPRLRDLTALRERLRAAVLEAAGDLPDVAARVMEALGVDDGWDPLAEALRQAVAAPAPALADEVMAALAPPPEARLSALHDGELAAPLRLDLAASLDRRDHGALSQYAELGRMVRESLRDHARTEALPDLWQRVAPGIGLPDPEHVPGWNPIATALQQAVADAGRLSPEEAVALTASVMNALPRPEPKPAEAPPPPEPVPLWRLLLGNPTLIVAAFAAMLIAFYGFDPGALAPPLPSPDVPELASSDIQLRAFNEAEVEALEYADEVIVQVVQLGEGAPILLMVDEGEPEGGATL